MNFCECIIISKQAVAKTSIADEDDHKWEIPTLHCDFVKDNSDRNIIMIAAAKEMGTVDDVREL